MEDWGLEVTRRKWCTHLFLLINCHPPWSGKAMPRIKCAYELPSFHYPSCQRMSQHLTPAHQAPWASVFYTAPIFTFPTTNCNPPNPPFHLHPTALLLLLLFEPVILLIQQITIHAWNSFCFRDVAVHLHHFIVHSQHSFLWRRKHILFMFTHPQHSGKGGHGLSACPAACYSTRT